MRNAKTIGLAVVAAFALSAVAASAASAESVFTAEKYPVTLTGHNEESDPTHFEIPGAGNVSCESVTYTGTATEARTSLTIEPDYSECSGPFGLSMKVHMNGCDYVFTPGEHTEETNTFHGSAHLVCPKDKDVTITIPESGSQCIVHVPEQTVDGITYTNKAAGDGTPKDWVTVDVSTTTLTYDWTKIGFFCTKATAIDAEDGILTGKVEIKGYEDGKAHTEANAVGIDVGTQNTG